MENIILILGIFLLSVSIFIFLKISKIKIETDKELQQKKKLQDDIQCLNIQLKDQTKDLEIVKELNKEQRNKFNDLIKQNQQIRKQANQLYDNGKKIAEKNLTDYKILCHQSANNYIDTLQEAYAHADAAHVQKLTRLKEEQTQAAAVLNNLKETCKAAHEALLRQQEIKDNKDNYRLLPSDNDLQDIHSLQRVKKNLHKPRILSMLIWQTFWQPIAKKQFPTILQDKTKIGIYKITNLETGESYIGQSVDIYKRWCDHCKAGLGIDTPVGNKLYKAIYSYGLQNFTFELLCECPKEELNEKEKYFIELYQADLYGYNGTGGNK